MALRVVSLPAVKSNEKKNISSSSPSAGGSSCGMRAWITTESRSSAGCLRFSRISVEPYAESMRPYSRFNASPDSASRPRSIHSQSIARSRCGTPSSRQIAWSGSSRATSVTKSQAPSAGTASRIARARRRSSGSSAPMRCGVKPLFTRPRIRRWRGSSIMLSIRPAPY